jgi:hypothetical protein
MDIKSKNNNILNIASKIKLNQQNHNKQANIDMKDIKREVCLLGYIISPKFKLYLLK